MSGPKEISRAPATEPSCASCGDLIGNYYCRRRRCYAYRDRCRECHRELAHGLAPRVSFACFAPPCSATFYGYSDDGTIGDPSPWHENAVRALEERWDDEE